MDIIQDVQHRGETRAVWVRLCFFATIVAPFIREDEPKGSINHDVIVKVGIVAFFENGPIQTQGLGVHLLGQVVQQGVDLGERLDLLRRAFEHLVQQVAPLPKQCLELFLTLAIPLPERWDYAPPFNVVRRLDDLFLKTGQFLFQFSVHDIWNLFRKDRVPKCQKPAGYPNTSTSKSDLVQLAF